MDVGHVVAIDHGVEPEFVGRAVDDPSLETTAGHPDRKAERVVVAATGVLGTRGTAKLTRPDHDRLVQQARSFQILQQTGDWPIDLGAELRNGSP